jgi:Uma2 family endonuclease
MAEQQTAVKPLAAGDRLTWPEFEERWDADPEIKRAELIGGRVYMPSPLSNRHGETQGDLATWLGHYAARTPGVRMVTAGACRMLQDAPQPDLLLRVLEDCGGQSRVRGKYLHGAPELVAEVCLTSAAYDLHDKMELYRTAGVQEFVAAILAENEVRWHRLVEGEYEVVATDSAGVIRAATFPGLWLHVPSLLSGDLAQLLQKLDTGLASPEHAAFAAELARRRKS